MLNLSFIHVQYERLLEFLRVFLRERHYFRTCWKMQNALKDHCLMFFPASLGDTLLVLSNLGKIEQEKKIKIMPVLKYSHTAIAELCGCHDYIACASPASPFIFIPVMLRYKTITGKAFFKKITPVLRAGDIFIAHSHYYHVLQKRYYENKCDSFDVFFDILFNVRGLRMPQLKYLFPLQETRKFNFKKMVVVCPEASSYVCNWGDFWNNLSSECKKLGYDVYFNSNGKNKKIKDATLLELPFRDILGVCQRAAFVISLRSGICDLLANKGPRLIVLYPDFDFVIADFVKYNPNSVSKRLCRNFYQFFDLNRLFCRNDIHSFIFDQNSADPKIVIDYLKRNTEISYLPEEDGKVSNWRNG